MIFRYNRRHILNHVSIAIKVLKKKYQPAYSKTRIIFPKTNTEDFQYYETICKHFAPFISEATCKVKIRISKNRLVFEEAKDAATWKGADGADCIWKVAFKTYINNV